VKRKYDTPPGQYPPKRPALSSLSAKKTAGAMKASGGDRAAAAKALGINQLALRTRLSWLRQDSDLDFPDKNHWQQGVVQQQTIKAMRDASGDRKQAALLLGINLGTLSARLCHIRNMREALKDE
jgi:DNA-binding protein Fis